MIIFPAIDIKDGKVVRLLQGRFSDVTEYSTDPVEMAKHWEQEGAQWLHIVDLDGAQTGEMKNINIIKKIARTLKIPIEVGGGIRKFETLTEVLLENNIRRVVLGTRAIQDAQFRKSIKSCLDRIAVSIDCSNGLVTQRGWTETLNIKGAEFAKQLENEGFKCLIYTDVATDGMLSGPNIAGLTEILNAVKIDVIASGGVAGLTDIQKLLNLKVKHDNLIGAITGKAIYEGKLTLKEALKLCSQRE